VERRCFVSKKADVMGIERLAATTAQHSADIRPPLDDDELRRVAHEQNAGLLALLKIEADAREARTREELQFLLANETRKLTAARQIFVFKAAAQLQLVTISGLPAVDHSAPFVNAIKQVVAALEPEGEYKTYRAFDLSACASDSQDYLDYLKNYPFRSLLWVPLLARDGNLLGGVLLARERAWTEADIAIVKRLAATSAHALALLIAEPRLALRLALRLFIGRKSVLAAVIATLLTMAIPVPMATLAPFEIGPLEPFVVAAPIEGVIESVLVDPGAEVTEGQPIVRFADTVLRNRLEVAEREVLVAEARLKKASQLAFDDVRGRQELGIAMAEHALKIAERDFAHDMFERATVNASRSGIALYSDKRVLIGKPVSLGERIMQIADPDHIEAVIDVAVGDAIVLKSGARAKIFLDSDPIRPREAKVEFADYEAHTRLGNTLAFRVVAKLLEADGERPRLGVRGTAQLFGERVPLAFYLFRRPLSALRQWIGL
jgi:hypothetical protein